MRVTLLSLTPNPIDTIYTAIRRCKSSLKGADLVKGKGKEKEKLIREVIERGHESVVEHVSFTFLIEEVSRALTHQLVRHRVASYSQQSQRAVKWCGEYIVPPSIRNRGDALSVFLECMNQITSSYRTLLECDIPKEDARYLLPNCVTTGLVMTANCRELRHFFRLRCKEDAQWEIRGLANRMLEICKEKLPCVFEDL